VKEMVLKDKIKEDSQEHSNFKEHSSPMGDQGTSHEAENMHQEECNPQLLSSKRDSDVSITLL
jgi:hypothetical protein